jgi:hypothetical protein
MPNTTTPNPRSSRFAQFMKNNNRTTAALTQPTETPTPRTPRPTRQHLEPEQLTDSIARHLYADDSLSDDQRADIWDVAHGKSTDELAQHLDTLPISPKLKLNLLVAKSKLTPAIPPKSVTEKISDAIHEMAKINPTLLDIAEKYPHIFKQMRNKNEHTYVWACVRFTCGGG